MSTVIITRDDRIDEAVDEALDWLPIETLVRDKVVAVKPNDTWVSPEDTTGVTQPDTLQAVLRHLKRFGPRQLVVTGGAGAARTGDVFAASGLGKVVDAVAADVAGARLLGFLPQAVRHLWEVGRAGLGETNLDALSFPAMSLSDVIEEFTETAYG